MKASEFIKRVERVAKQRGISCRFDAARGKGSHGTLYFGDKRTVVKDRRKEVGRGLLHSMLNDLGLAAVDIL